MFNLSQTLINLVINCKIVILKLFLFNHYHFFSQWRRQSGNNFEIFCTYTCFQLMQTMAHEFRLLRLDQEEEEQLKILNVVKVTSNTLYMSVFERYK